MTAREVIASAPAADKTELQAPAPAPSLVSRAFGFLVPKSLADVVALAAAALGLVYLLVPGVKPDPEAKLSATLETVAVERGVEQQEYLRRANNSTALAGLSPDERQVRGLLFYVREQTEGLKSQRSELRWFVYDARTRTRVPTPASESGRHVQTRSGTPSDVLVVPVWIQPPVDPGRYYLRFELRAKGVLLAIADSPPFPHCPQDGCPTAVASSG